MTPPPPHHDECRPFSYVVKWGYLNNKMPSFVVLASNIAEKINNLSQWINAFFCCNNEYYLHSTYEPKNTYTVYYLPVHL